MKRIVVIAMVVAIGGIGASVAASAVHAVAAWSTSKTEHMLTGGATVQLPAPERATLARQLRQEVTRYLALGYAAAELGDHQAAMTYHQALGEYRRALRAVLGGIEIVDADCVGAGRVQAAQRFRRLDCLVTSEVLSIPTIELESAEGDALPGVVERAPRSIGPLVTWVKVRVTGTSSFTYA